MSQAYPLLLAAASFAGLVWLDRRMPAGFARRLEAGPIIVAGGLAGARLGFVALRLPYFSAHPIEMAWLWQGGLSWIGAAAGALAASALAARLTGVSFWLLLDVLAVPATLVSLAAWTGCLVDSFAWGRTVDWGPFGYDSLGNLARRWPTQAVGMVLSGILLAALLSFGGRSLPSGLLGAFALAALAAVTTGLSLTRGDPSMLVGPWRIDTVAGSAVVLAAGAAAMWRRRAST